MCLPPCVFAGGMCAGVLGRARQCLREMHGCATRALLFCCPSAVLLPVSFLSNHYSATQPQSSTQATQSTMVSLADAWRRPRPTTTVLLLLLLLPPLLLLLLTGPARAFHAAGALPQTALSKCTSSGAAGGSSSSSTRLYAALTDTRSRPRRRDLRIGEAARPRCGRGSIDRRTPRVSPIIHFLITTNHARAHTQATPSPKCRPKGTTRRRGSVAAGASDGSGCTRWGWERWERTSRPSFWRGGGR